MSVREQKMAETRKKLIEVARRAFAAYGYAGTSMDKLTAEAGLTRGALYHHFGDKKGLFAAVVDQIDSEMASSAQQHLEQPDDLWDGLMLEGRTYRLCWVILHIGQVKTDVCSPRVNVLSNYW